MPFTSVIRFEVRPGREDVFEAAFEAAGMLVRPKSIDGFVEAKLVRCQNEPTEYLVIAEWETEEAYSSWQAVSGKGVDEEVMTRLLESLDSPQPGRLFSTVAVSTGRG